MTSYLNYNNYIDYTKQTCSSTADLMKGGEILDALRVLVDSPDCPVDLFSTDYGQFDDNVDSYTSSGGGGAFPPGSRDINTNTRTPYIDHTLDLVEDQPDSSSMQCLLLVGCYLDSTAAALTDPGGKTSLTDNTHPFPSQNAVEIMPNAPKQWQQSPGFGVYNNSQNSFQNGSFTQELYSGIGNAMSEAGDSCYQYWGHTHVNSAEDSRCWTSNVQGHDYTPSTSSQYLLDSGLSSGTSSRTLPIKQEPVLSEFCTDSLRKIAYTNSSQSDFNCAELQENCASLSSSSVLPSPPYTMTCSEGSINNSCTSSDSSAEEDDATVAPSRYNRRYKGGGVRADRRLRRREQNRQAARRCRQRKKEQSQELIKEYYQLLSANSEIQSNLKLLENEKKKLEDIYKGHLERCSVSITPTHR